MDSVPFTNLKDTLICFIDLFREWFFAALHPARQCQCLLSIRDSDARLAKALKLWMISFVIALVVDLPLYHPYGIGLSSVEFHLSIFVCLTLALVACGFAIHLGLRIYGIRSTFSDVAAVYIAYVMCYQPLLNLLSYFASYRMFSLLALARVQRLDLDRTVGFLLAQATVAGNRHDLTSAGSGLSSLLLLAVSCLCSALMATAFTDRYSVPRLKSFSALAFAMMVLVPPILLLEGVLVAYIEFTFISASGLAPLSH
jgi:hypothetical protein